MNGNLNTLRIEILSYTVLVAVKILTDVFKTQPLSRPDLEATNNQDLRLICVEKLVPKTTFDKPKSI